MCCGDWKNHGSEYYECSRYKSNPNIVNESAGIQAREALKKYLFYFERVCNNQGRGLDPRYLAKKIRDEKLFLSAETKSIEKLKKKIVSPFFHHPRSFFGGELAVFQKITLAKFEVHG